MVVMGMGTENQDRTVFLLYQFRDPARKRVVFPIIKNEQMAAGPNSHSAVIEIPNLHRL